MKFKELQDLVENTEIITGIKMTAAQAQDSSLTYVHMFIPFHWNMGTGVNSVMSISDFELYTFSPWMIIDLLKAHGAKVLDKWKEEWKKWMMETGQTYITPTYSAGQILSGTGCAQGQHTGQESSGIVDLTHAGPMWTYFTGQSSMQQPTQSSYPNLWMHTWSKPQPSVQDNYLKPSAEAKEHHSGSHKRKRTPKYGTVKGLI